MKKILRFAAALACGLCLMGTAARAEEGASPALQQPQELRAVYLAPGRDFDPAASEEDCRPAEAMARTAPFPPRRCRAPARCWPI